MIWYPQSSPKFLATFPLVGHFQPKPFGDGDEPISAVCCGYVVLADGNGLVAMPREMRTFVGPTTCCWRKVRPVASAEEARAIIGRAPLNRAWFKAREWERVEVPRG